MMAESGTTTKSKSGSEITLTHLEPLPIIKESPYEEGSKCPFSQSYRSCRYETLITGHIPDLLSRTKYGKKFLNVWVRDTADSWAEKWYHSRQKYILNTFLTRRVFGGNNRGPLGCLPWYLGGNWTEGWTFGGVILGVLIFLTAAIGSYMGWDDNWDNNEGNNVYVSGVITKNILTLSFLTACRNSMITIVLGSHWGEERWWHMAFLWLSLPLALRHSLQAVYGQYDLGHWWYDGGRDFFSGKVTPYMIRNRQRDRGPVTDLYVFGGLVSLILLFCFAFTALPIFGRGSIYQYWYYLHVLNALLLIAFGFLHGVNGWGLYVWFVDCIIRFWLFTGDKYGGNPSYTGECTILGGLRIPEILSENHPQSGDTQRGSSVLTQALPQVRESIQGQNNTYVKNREGEAFIRIKISIDTLKDSSSSLSTSCSGTMPGQYIYIRCKEVSRFEWHPFSISYVIENTAEDTLLDSHTTNDTIRTNDTLTARPYGSNTQAQSPSSQEENSRGPHLRTPTKDIFLYCKVLGDWTYRLALLVEEKSLKIGQGEGGTVEVNFDIDGPYGRNYLLSKQILMHNQELGTVPRFDMDPKVGGSDERHIILFAGGIGATGVLSYWKKFREDALISARQKNKAPSVKSVTMVLVLPQSNGTEDILNSIEPILLGGCTDAGDIEKGNATTTVTSKAPYPLTMNEDGVSSVYVEEDQDSGTVFYFAVHLTSIQEAEIMPITMSDEIIKRKSSDLFGLSTVSTGAKVARTITPSNQTRFIDEIPDPEQRQAQQTSSLTKTLSLPDNITMRDVTQNSNANTTGLIIKSSLLPYIIPERPRFEQYIRKIVEKDLILNEKLETENASVSTFSGKHKLVDIGMVCCGPRRFNEMCRREILSVREPKKSCFRLKYGVYHEEFGGL